MSTSTAGGNEARRRKLFPPVLRVLLCYIIAASLQYFYLNYTASHDSPSIPSTGSFAELTLPGTIRLVTMDRTDRTNWKIKPGEPLSLDHLTEGSVASCPSGFVLIENVPNPNKLTSTLPLSTTTRTVPHIVHQTARSRCATNAIADAAAKWRFPDWSYYFHDDEATMRLFRNEFSEFPHLEMIVEKCLLHGTLRADLWRYLVLWKYGGINVAYGGIYADIDSAPNKFSPETFLQGDVDALFVIEQYHLLSQYFLAVSPRHPLMWYAIQHSLSNLLQAPDTGSVPAALVTGPHALHSAFTSFRNDVGGSVDPAIPGNKPVWAGTFLGTQNRSLTAIGVAADQNEYIERDVLRWKKKKEYKMMSMRHFQEDKKYPSGRSCMSTLFDLYRNDPQT